MLITVNRHSSHNNDKVQINTSYVEYVEQVRGAYTYLAVHLCSGKVIEVALTMEDWLRLAKQGTD